jgi:hypothetical protein
MRSEPDAAGIGGRLHLVDVALELLLVDEHAGGTEGLEIHEVSVA